MGRTFRIVTLGCKVNQYESAYLAERLLKEGWLQAERDEPAEVTVVNTCIVTQRAAYQSRQAIRKALRENPDGTVAAAGCYAQVFPEELVRIKGVGLVADNLSKGRLAGALLEEAEGQKTLLGSFSRGLPFEFLAVRNMPDRTRVFLKIQDGCESFCTYCIVPRARGPLRSLAPPEVVRALRSLAAEGTREVVLTGIHLGKYGVDLHPPGDLKGLLGLVGRERLQLRIRLSSLEPTEVDSDLVERVASEPWLCRHFHIPLQSGDDRVLERMHRSYRARDFAGLVEAIHNRMPLAAIGVDVMVGFPGEDEEAYRNTRDLIRDLPVSYLHVFPFSPRKGTPAATFDGQVETRVAGERAAELRSLGLQKRKVFYRSCLGKEFSVLTEGWHSEMEKRVKGLSDNYLPLRFSSEVELKNLMVRARAQKVEGGAIMGVLVEKPAPRS